jgi:UPF0755 protein
MINSRIAYAVAITAAVGMTALAAWVIIDSPREIDDGDAYRTPAAGGEPVLITVSEGESPETIGDRLEQFGAIDSGTQFRVLVSLMGFEGLLQSGEYEFAAGSSILDVVYRIRNGLVSTRIVTVIEGWQLGEIADAVAAQGISREEFIAAASRTDYEYGFLAGMPPGSDLNGYLYPATYTIRASDTGETVVRMMLDAFAANVPEGVSVQAAAQGITAHDAVTIASIIQREAQIPEEKPVMAQVFLTRLQLGIPLEADPTVQFAVAQDPASVAQFGYWKAGLTLDDLAIDSPYNTYLYAGVPPGPISSPASDTMLAVVQPAATNFLYFVARPDGSHAFAETLEEHLANVAEFQSPQAE